MAVLRICSAEGEAKIVPATAASQRPWPTKPAKAGSWPEPPPVTMETLFGFRGASGRRKTILFSTSNARDGLVRVREFNAVKTRWFGSVKKCLARKTVSPLHSSWKCGRKYSSGTSIPGLLGVTLGRYTSTTTGSGTTPHI